ncbi:SDR family NAD(P)-dependent oxidoreductase [Mucilaginibacter xinganensis]|uniref:Short-chain dehydrogenase n=1 Tax=Mucilaginibacter xinganensis TaxID=1234841 RepID=A0A223P4T9_9SPHI|nr:SDR family oxidoreductase [Mucilaginibacter xinganensis]ASU36821.1 short-chain dehydrogenase [Mucilaginibacter xinganensis]
MSKTYVISGAGSGIGRAIAQALSGGGHNCILLGRNAENLRKTLETLTKSNHQILIADIKDKESLKKASDLLSVLSIDGLIANSGLGGENHWGEDDRWDDIITTNLTGTYNFVNTFLPYLNKPTGVKQVVIISSVLARLGVPNYSAYCASKAGLLGLMRSWATQYAPRNILVNAICPGWVNTDMAQSGLQGIADGIGISKQEFYEMAMKSVPLGRMSDPEEIAQLVTYLLSQSSITGQAIDINCGAVMNS